MAGERAAMTRAPRWKYGAALLAAAALAVVACSSHPGVRTPPPPPPGPEPEPSWLAEVAPSAEPAAAISPVEAGFTHCCGSEQYRIEIECGEMLKRCYENKGGIWRQTYGRHCKEQLGEACYLERCDAKCQ
jgi:hypothetical protein